MIARRPQWAAVVLMVVLLGSASIGIFAIRRSILRAAGWALVVNDRIEPTDVIVVSIDADGAGALEAADLVHAVWPQESQFSLALKTLQVTSSSAAEFPTKTKPLDPFDNSGRLASRQSTRSRDL